MSWPPPSASRRESLGKPTAVESDELSEARLTLAVGGGKAKASKPDDKQEFLTVTMKDTSISST